MQIYIVRHGQTDWNKEQLIAGQSDVNLTEIGRQQARLLGERLSSVHFDQILSSDLSRARETTELIAKQQKQTPMFIEELRERHWGDDEGKPVSEYLANIEKFGGEFWAYRPKGGESLADLKERVSRWLAGFLEGTRGEKVLLSAHHTMNKMLIHLLLRRDWGEWPSLKQDNTCVNIIEYLGSEFSSVLLNCAKHLENEV